MRRSLALGVVAACTVLIPRVLGITLVLSQPVAPGSRPLPGATSPRRWPLRRLVDCRRRSLGPASPAVQDCEPARPGYRPSRWPSPSRWSFCWSPRSRAPGAAPECWGPQRYSAHRRGRAHVLDVAPRLSRGRSAGCEGHRRGHSGEHRAEADARGLAGIASIPARRRARPSGPGCRPGNGTRSRILNPCVGRDQSGIVSTLTGAVQEVSCDPPGLEYSGRAARWQPKVSTSAPVAASSASTSATVRPWRIEETATSVNVREPVRAAGG